MNNEILTKFCFQFEKWSHSSIVLGIGNPIFKIMLCYKSSLAPPPQTILSGPTVVALGNFTINCRHCCSMCSWRHVISMRRARQSLWRRPGFEVRLAGYNMCYNWSVVLQSYKVFVFERCYPRKLLKLVEIPRFPIFRAYELTACK